jgi:hypothetical protein
VDVPYLSGIGKVNPKRFQNRHILGPLFKLAAFHVCFFKSRTFKCKNSDGPFDHKPPRTIFLTFSFLVTETMNLRHSSLYVRRFSKEHNSYNILINSISTHLAPDLKRNSMLVSEPEFESTHSLLTGSRVSSSSLSTINHTKPKPRGLPIHNCHCHSSSSLNEWSHAHYC